MWEGVVRTPLPTIMNKRPWTMNVLTTCKILAIIYPPYFKISIMFGLMIERGAGKLGLLEAHSNHDL